MPTALETQYMAEFCAANQILIQPGGGFPLVTYWGLGSAASLAMKKFDGPHIRALLLGLGHGLTPDLWPDFLLNLNPKAAGNDGPQRLAAGTWISRWNGMWIHQGHGSAGRVLFDTYKTGAKFYDLVGRHVLHRPGFQFALIKTCMAAEREEQMNESRTESLLEALARAAFENGNGARPRLYGARCVTWVPLAGLAAGKPCLDPIALVRHVTGLHVPNGASETVALAKMAEVRAHYFAASPDEMNEVERMGAHSLDRLAGAVTPAFVADAAFDPARALPLPLVARGEPEPATPNDAEAQWYGVNM